MSVSPTRQGAYASGRLSLPYQCIQQALNKCSLKKFYLNSSELTYSVILVLAVQYSDLTNAF